jgi:hypothetical protein
VALRLSGGLGTRGTVLDKKGVGVFDSEVYSDI